MASTRIEKDSLGEIEVPAERYYGAQTERARRNFPISRPALPAPLHRRAGADQGRGGGGQRGAGARRPARWRRPIRQAADEVIDGQLDDQFALDIFQTGSGTSTNMNANEVIANRANEIARRQAAARKSRSTPTTTSTSASPRNDVIPTAIHVAALLAHRRGPGAGARARWREALDAQGERVRRRRQDRPHASPGRDADPARARSSRATPQQVQQRLGAARRASSRACAELPLGGTAVGTGHQRAPGVRRRGHRAPGGSAPGIAFVEAPNHFEAQAAKDAVVEASGALKTIAVSLTKIANDIRWLASGPRCGIGEITHPRACSRAARSCRARSTRSSARWCCMVARPGDRQRRDDHLRPAWRATSS